MHNKKNHLISSTIIVLTYSVLSQESTIKSGNMEYVPTLPVSHAVMVSKLNDNLPKGWTVDVMPQTVPSGHSVKQTTGTAMLFKGLEDNYPVGRKTGPKQKERFSLWLMPLEYSPEIAPVDMNRPYSPNPEKLGSNGAFKVYCLTSVESCPTWPSWREDIVRLMGLGTANSTSTRKPLRLECLNVHDCFLVGMFKTDNGSVYMLKLEANDPKTYFVRAGDFIGDYLLSEEQIKSEGKSKVVLKKASEILVLPDRNPKNDESGPIPTSPVSPPQPVRAMEGVTSFIQTPAMVTTVSTIRTTM